MKNFVSVTKIFNVQMAEKFGGGKISRGTLIKISKSPFLKKSERPLKISFGKILMFDMTEVPNIHWESLICFPFKCISLL